MNHSEEAWAILWTAGEEPFFVHNQEHGPRLFGNQGEAEHQAWDLCPPDTFAIVRVRVVIDE